MKYKKQRDAAVTLLYSKNSMSAKQIAEELSEVSNSPVSEKDVKYAILSVTQIKEDSKDL